MLSATGGSFFTFNFLYAILSIDDFCDKIKITYMAGPSKKIAIVDDELSFLNLFSEFLSKSGYDVVKFWNPREALIKIGEEKLDLILLDIAMPEIDGLEVFEYLKSDLKEKMPKTIFLTNLDETAGGVKLDPDFAKSVGAQGYIRKTDGLDVMLEKIKEELR